MEEETNIGCFSPVLAGPIFAAGCLVFVLMIVLGTFLTTLIFGII